MDEKPQFCDGGADVEYDDDLGIEAGLTRLRFSGRDRGCSCCTTSAEVYGDRILDYLDYHRDAYQRRVDWFTKAAELIREYGDAKIADTLRRVIELERKLDVAWGIVGPRPGPVPELRYERHYKFLHPHFSDWKSAVEAHIRDAETIYSGLGTVDKLLAEFFESHRLGEVAEMAGKLAELGYGIGDLPKENTDE